MQNNAHFRIPRGKLNNFRINANRLGLLYTRKKRRGRGINNIRGRSESGLREARRGELVNFGEAWKNCATRKRIGISSEFSSITYARKCGKNLIARGVEREREKEKFRNKLKRL